MHSQTEEPPPRRKKSFLMWCTTIWRTTAPTLLTVNCSIRGDSQTICLGRFDTERGLKDRRCIYGQILLIIPFFHNQFWTSIKRTTSRGKHWRPTCTVLAPFAPLLDEL
jgi:hypothetical protein